MNKLISSLVAVLAASLLLAAPALAQTSPLLDAYGGPGGQVLTDTGTDTDDVIPGPTAPVEDEDGTNPRTTSGGDDTVPVERGADTPPATTAGDLPFTGFEAGIVLAAGMALLGAGLVARRAGRQS